MPSGIHDVARVLIVLGLLMVGVGVALLLAPKLPWLGRLPGDIVVQRERFTLYAPLATSLLISLVVSLVLWLFGRR